MNDRLERLETLAAWAAGELDDASRAGVEALLASDPAAEGDLEQLAGLDRLLASQASPALPAGAHERLLAALEPVVDDQLGPGPQTTSRLRSIADRLLNAPLMPRLAAGAVALVVIAGAGIGLSQIGGQSEGFQAVQGDLDVATDAADGAEAAPEALPQASLLYGGDYDEARARALLNEYAALDRGERSDDSQAAPAEPLDPAEGSAVTSGEQADGFFAAESCTAKLFASEDGVELHRELATYNDEPAVVTVIERPDGDLELWVLAQSDCGTLLFHETR